MWFHDVVVGITGNAAWYGILRTIGAPFTWAGLLLRAGSPWKLAEVCLQYRQHARNRYYEAAFDSGRDVLYISIMSEGTLKAMQPLLERAQKSNTRLRVLTWHHDISDTVIEAFRQHLGEHDYAPERTSAQVRQAAVDWRQLESIYSNLQVREYRSAPTMQGYIVEGKYAVVELMPYRVHPTDRPALVLRPHRDRQMYTLLRQRFELLWNDSRASEQPNKALEPSAPVRSRSRS